MLTPSTRVREFTPALGALVQAALRMGLRIEKNQQTFLMRDVSGVDKMEGDSGVLSACNGPHPLTNRPKKEVRLAE